MVTRSQVPASASPLRVDAAFSGWVDHLDRLGAPTEPVVVPDGDALLHAMDFLAIPDDDRPHLLATRDRVAGDPDLRWLLERSVQLLRERMGSVERPKSFPSLPDSCGDVGSFFYAWVYILMIPDALAEASRRGIPEAVVRATMADVGRHFRIHRAQTGAPGMSGQDWLMLHPRGIIFQLGRLQFERAKLGGRTSAGMREAGISAERGEPVLAIHIPSFEGPLTPEASDDAFAQASGFFARHFPEETYRFAVCHSWLLDPQLAEYLPSESNLIAFQRRFRIAYIPDADDRNILEFVFRAPDRPLDELPLRTTLERAVVAHIRSGRHWTGAAGWLPFDVR